MRTISLLTGLLLVLVVTSVCRQSTETEDEAFARLVVENCAEISPADRQLSPDAAELLAHSIDSASLVAVGESRHDTREQIQVKHQIFAQLTTELGFTALILEESFYHAQALDRYVTTGDGDVRATLNQLAGWYLWDTEEMVALVQWIRDENASRSDDDMIHVYGMDITAPADGVREALRYLATHGVSSAPNESALRLDLHQGDFWPAIWSAYSALSVDEKEELAAQYATLVDAFIVLEDDFESLQDAREFQTMRMYARAGQFGNRLFSSEDRAAGGVVREQGMFAVVQHLLNHQSPGAKAMIWTHNLHAVKSTFRMPSFSEGTHVPVGVLLKQEYSERYVSIGAAFGTGSFPADLPPGAREFELLTPQSVDGALARAMPRGFLVDLRTVAANTQASRWLAVEREWRAQEFNSYMIPGDAFDLVFYVQTVTRAQPTPLALARFQSMGG